jgi:hypothetical protein
MDFRERLQQATERGIQSRDERISAAAAQALSEEGAAPRSELPATLCDHIEGVSAAGR